MNVSIEECLSLKNVCHLCTTPQMFPRIDSFLNTSHRSQRTKLFGRHIIVWFMAIVLANKMKSINISLKSVDIIVNKLMIYSSLSIASTIATSNHWLTIFGNTQESMRLWAADNECSWYWYWQSRLNDHFLFLLIHCPNKLINRMQARTGYKEMPYRTIMFRFGSLRQKGLLFV